MDWWLDTSFGPKLPWTSFYASDPKCYSFVIQKFFYVKLHKIFHKTRSYFQILGHFWQSSECLFPENCKKTIKNLFFGAIPDM